MGLFGTKKVAEKETTVKDCVRMIEGFFRKVKLNPNEYRLPDRDTLGWFLQRGSARIYILLNQQGETKTVQIISPILYLPEDHILPFYRRCLEMNMHLINCAFAASDDKIVLVSERPLEGLDQQELEGMIQYLSAVADDIDDKLGNEFKAQLYIKGLEGA